MNITLTKQQQDFVRQELNSGFFQSENDVVTAGLEMLQQYKSRLHANIIEGIEDAQAGRSEEFTPQVARDIVREIEQELALKAT